MLTLLACLSAPVVATDLAESVTEYKVELPAELRRMAGRGETSPVTHALVTIATPGGHRIEDDRPVLVVSATSDATHQSSRALLRAYAKTALASGWILVAASLRRAGFENVRLVSTSGGHDVDPGPLGDALDWFVPGRTVSEPRPGA